MNQLRGRGSRVEGRAIIGQSGEGRRGIAYRSVSLSDNRRIILAQRQSLQATSVKLPLQTADYADCADDGVQFFDRDQPNTLSEIRELLSVVCLTRRPNRPLHHDFKPPITQIAQMVELD